MNNSSLNSSNFISIIGIGYKKRLIVTLSLLALIATSIGCRYDMQDQPRLKAYRGSDFFADGKGMRDHPDGTIARGHLNADKALHTGKKKNIDPNIVVETTTDASGNTLVSSFPNDIEEIPIPVTEELLDRGQEKYNIYCIVCHGPVGKGDGMVVKRGYPQPPTYHDDRLRAAPVGHFFDVITNGWGKMSSYSSQIPVNDRWAIVAYIRALQLSQNPDGVSSAPAGNSNNANSETPKADDSKDNENDAAAKESEEGGK